MENEKAAPEQRANATPRPNTIRYPGATTVPSTKNSDAPETRRANAGHKDRVEQLTYTIVIGVLAAVPLLAFVFSFGNVGLHGVALGVDWRIAYLTGPAVDLSVVGLIVAGSYLSHRGYTEKQLWPVHLMSVLCGAVMLYLNCGQALYEHRWRLAVFDAVGPLLLVGWGAIGPWLLRHLGFASTTARPVMVAVTGQQSAANRQTVLTTVLEPAARSVPEPQNGQDPTVQTDRPRPRQNDLADRPRTAKTVPAATDQTVPAKRPELDWDVLAEIGLPVYEAVKETAGKRPPERMFLEALSTELAKRVASGELPQAYADPSLSTAKRVRKEVETRFPDLTPLHLIEQAS